MRLLVLAMEGQVEDGRIVLLLLGGSFSLFFLNIYCKWLAALCILCADLNPILNEREASDEYK